MSGNISHICKCSEYACGPKSYLSYVISSYKFCISSGDYNLLVDAFGVVTFISATTATFCRKVKGKMLPEFAGCLVMKIPKAQNSALLQLLSADGNKCWS